MLDRFLTRLRFFLRRDRLDRLDDELREEMALHIELRTAELVENGMSPADARAAALRRFGNATLLREQSRTMWTFSPLETWVQDVRYATRMMRRTKALTLVVVVSLAIGVGANTAIFAMANDVVLRKLPVQAPNELVLLSWVSSVEELPISLWGTIGDSDNGGKTSVEFTASAYTAFRERTDLFTELFAFKAVGRRANVMVNGFAELAAAQVVSGNYFRALGVSPVIGRTITEDDDRPDSGAVAVIAYGYWQRRFGGAPSAIGATINVNGVPTTVIGVSPQGFKGTLGAGRAPDLTMPLAQLARVMPDADRLTADDRWWIEMMGRRAPGVSQEKIETALGTVFSRVVADLPSVEVDAIRLVASSGARGLTPVRTQVADRLAVMAMVAALVLLIACANVANLLLSRAEARQKEMAVRAAIGAGRGRLLRQLLTESILLAGLGAVGGIALARGLAEALLVALDLDLTNPARFDWPVLGFTLVLSMGCGLLFGLAPALRGTRSSLTNSLNDRTLGAIGGRNRSRMAAGMLVTQMALAVLLSVGGGLLLRTVINLGRVDVGFDPSRLLVLELDPTLAGYEGDSLRDLYARILVRLRGLPGVESASLSEAGLIADSLSITRIIVPGFEGEVQGPFGPSKRPFALVHTVDPEFFDTIRLPLRLGRSLSETDAIGAQRVVVVNEALARLYFPDQNPIGGHFKIGSGADAPTVEIVGVVADMPYDSLRRGLLPTFYSSYRQSVDLGAVTFEIRTNTPPLELVSAVRAVIHEIEPRVPIDGVRTEEEQIVQSYREERVYATLVSTLGAVGLLLAAIGLYGLQAYQVARRTHEIGVRMALGATRGALAWLVLAQSFRLAVAGSVLGVLAALFTTRTLASFLFGLTPADPATVVGATLLLLTVTAVASYIPARRASRVDPTVALRAD